MNFLSLSLGVPDCIGFLLLHILRKGTGGIICGGEAITFWGSQYPLTARDEGTLQWVSCLLDVVVCSCGYSHCC